MRGMGGMAASNVQQVLFVLRSADLTLTSDQIFTKLFGGSNYIITGIFANRKTGAFGVACLGGIYNAASKGGTAIVAAAQSWALLTGAATSVAAVVATQIVQTATPIGSSPRTWGTRSEYG